MSSDYLRAYDNYEIKSLIDQYVRGERDRAILKRRFVDKIGIEQLAEEFDLSVSQTKRILQLGKEQLFYHLERRMKDEIK